MSIDRLIISSRCGNEKNKHSNSTDSIRFDCKKKTSNRINCIYTVAKKINNIIRTTKRLRFI